MKISSSTICCTSTHEKYLSAIFCTSTHENVLDYNYRVGVLVLVLE